MFIQTLILRVNNITRKIDFLIFHIALRKPYKQPNEYFGTEHLVSHEPFGQFKKWFEEAVEHTEEPNAFCLATATK
jgi:pyridoxine/pyridoxamine 5'-phosphate oxidase